MICEFCNRTEFISEYALRSHKSRCRLNPNAKQPKPSSLTAEQKRSIAYKNKERAISRYNQNPCICKGCNQTIPYDKRTNKTCSSVCRSALSSLINKDRYKDPNYALRKNASLRLTLANKPHKQRRYTDKTSKGKIAKNTKICSKKLSYSYKNDLRIQYRTSTDYIKIYYNNCSHCNTKFLYSSQQKYCNEHTDLYKANQRNRFVFTFNVYHYPDLFDLNLLVRYKWRCSKTNPNGITRDHRVSVNEAIRNGYDPYYIKHPLNCELMLFNENNRKRHNSSITYEELVRLVDMWEKN